MKTIYLVIFLFSSQFLLAQNASLDGAYYLKNRAKNYNGVLRQDTLKLTTTPTNYDGYCGTAGNRCVYTFSQNSLTKKEWCDPAYKGDRFDASNKFEWKYTGIGEIEIWYYEIRPTKKLKMRNKYSIKYTDHGMTLTLLPK